MIWSFSNHQTINQVLCLALVKKKIVASTKLQLGWCLKVHIPAFTTALLPDESGLKRDLPEIAKLN